LALTLGASRRFAAITLAALLLIVGGTLVVDYLPLLTGDLPVALDNLGTFASALVASLLCLAVAATPGSHKARFAWLLLGAGFAASMVAEWIWFHNQAIAHVEAPFPSAADAFYLALYPLAFVAVLILANPTAGNVRRAVVVLDSLLLTVALAGLAWQFVLEPTIAETQGLSGAAVVLSIAYPAADLLLCFALASLFFAWDLHHVPRPLLWLLGGFAVMVVADLGFAWQILQNEYDSGSVFDPLWTISYALIAIAGLQQLRETSASIAGTGATSAFTVDLGRASFLRLALPYLALPAAGGLVILHFRATGGLGGEGTIVLVFSVLLLCLVLVRQFLTLLENLRLSRSLSSRTQELALLNRVAADLGQCLTTEEVARTGLERACDALHAQHGAVWLGDVNGAASLIAGKRDTDDDASLAALASENAAVTAAIGRSETCVVDIGGESQAAPSRPSDRGAAPYLVLAPLVARGTVLGSLGVVLEAAVVGVPARLQLLEAIAAQMGVAAGTAQQYEKARYLADRDSLTGLLNHRAFQARLETECADAVEKGTSFSVVMMDLDGFKRLNDSLGHQAGDTALRQVATHLQQSLRDTDIIGRYGGDEFVALLPETGKDVACGLCDRLRAGLSVRRRLAEHGYTEALRLSCGVSAYPEDALSAQGLIGAADRNLYISKLRGGDRVTVGEDTGEEEAAAAYAADPGRVPVVAGGSAARSAAT
jgi:diguanylate cyclase (GGDEF)-like protein